MDSKVNPRLHQILCWITLMGFLTNSLIFPVSVSAQMSPSLPNIGERIALAGGYAPPVLKGIQIFPDKPLQFNFIMDLGDAASLSKEGQVAESQKLIKYFLATLTTPKEDLWVNLSPYEKNRIIPENFGVTQMGRDLLAQDYLLKQITASVIYPEDELGKKFWDQIYKVTHEKFGTTNVPVNTFNKVWIVPDKAIVYEDGDRAFITESHLKVMLESDYLALSKANLKSQDTTAINDVSSQVVRDIVIPALEKEVNEGQHFALLRQVYHSLILAVWYKKNLRESILGKAYVGKNKTSGIDIEDKAEKEKIYQKYLEAFKKGAYNYI
ncbi:MAG: hypothetical protein NUV91_08065, partial [Candidatus Omnitrophica bacterium]|nr:hypothetical protein [Candidatus Omnitrophota bacterium]